MKEVAYSSGMQVEEDKCNRFVHLSQVSGNSRDQFWYGKKSCNIKDRNSIWPK